MEDFTFTPNVKDQFNQLYSCTQKHKGSAFKGDTNYYDYRLWHHCTCGHSHFHRCFEDGHK